MLTLFLRFQVVHLVSHSISVSCELPIWTPSYTVPAHLEAGFQRSIEELLRLDIIEPSTSAWSSPPIPIIKKDGDVRIVCDYRKLNSVTLPEPFKMPTIEEILSRLGRAKSLSKLDLQKGFHQVPVAPASRDFTAFSCRHGQFRYKRMPFGLRNAPATFQLLMQEVLRGLEEYSSAYIDEIVIFSSNWKDHLYHIDSVLARLSVHGLTGKVSKCRWGYHSFEFLGFDISEGKLIIPQARVLQLQNFVRPKSIAQLRSFLGLANFYSKFIPRFAEFTKSLTAQTKRNSPKNIVWTTYMIQSFSHIIESISNATQLVVPCLSDNFAVFCDAASRGVGEVLCVYREEQWCPVAFYSRQMKDREARYSATEIEALAMLSLILHFAYYLVGTSFTVYTDHKGLVHLFDSPSLNNRLWRWKVKLLDFTFSIVYIEGSKNVVADSLSRQGWEDQTSSKPQEQFSEFTSRMEL